MGTKDFPIVHMPCRRGSDKVTHGQVCNCKRAYNMTQPGSKYSYFKCVDCGHAWVVSVGGSFNIT